MTSPAVSVALPVYNAARYLEAAVSSILLQSFRDFELIAVDDGSTDDSLARLKRLASADPRVRVISRPNTGLAGALNDAWRIGTAPLVARMDADDVAFPDRFARQVTHLAAHPELVALGAAVVYIDPAGRPVNDCPRPLDHSIIEPALLRGDGGSIIHPVVMLRRSALEAIDGYRMDVPYVEDLDLYLRLTCVGRVANLPEPLLYYRVHPQSMNFVKFGPRRKIKLRVLEEAHRARGLEFDPATVPDANSAWADVASHHRNWAVTALKYGRRRVAVGHALRACRLKPSDRRAWSCLAYALRAPKEPFPATIPPPDWFTRSGAPTTPRSATPKRLLYLGQTPASGTGSSVTVLRHLRRFAAEGWEIELVPNWGDRTAEAEHHGWRLHRLPHRRFWWPPYRHGSELSREFTTALWAREVDRLVRPRPDAVLTYLAFHSDLFTEIAAAYGRRTRVPVSCLIHDDAVEFGSASAHRTQLRRRQHRILRDNHRNWFVSATQAAEMIPTGAHSGILAPIPEGFDGPAPQWRPEFAHLAPVYFAGYLWPEQGNLLRQLAPVLGCGGARLVVLGHRTPEVEAMVAADLADHVPSFPDNAAALAHLASHAAGLIVSYAATVEELPWSRTSMPSKLVEYCHLGLPIALVVPPTTAIADWARRRGLPAIFAPADHAGLTAWVTSLRSAATWGNQLAVWRELAADEWSPAAIHAKLAAGLLRSSVR